MTTPRAAALGDRAHDEFRIAPDAAQTGRREAGLIGQSDEIEPVDGRARSLALPDSPVGVAHRPTVDAEDDNVSTHPAPQRITQAADPRVIFEHEDLPEAFEHAKPLVIEAVQPGHVHDAEAETSLGQKLRGEKRLVEHHRPVREKNRVGAFALAPVDVGLLTSFSRGSRIILEQAAAPDRPDRLCVLCQAQVGPLVSLSFGS